MKIRSTSQSIAAVVVAIAALTALTGVAQAATSKPAQMSKAEYRALMLRSEALNEKYQLGDWKGAPTGMTAAAYRALVLRSEAMNKHYGLGKWSASAATAARTQTSSSEGFAWDAFGIGAVAMLGLVLLTAGAIAGTRYTRGAPHVRTS
jgi:hypothetical protein